MYRARQQRGMVLLASLILLLVITVVGFSVMETSNMEVKMATAKEMKEISFQAAEAIAEVATGDIDYLGEALAADLAGSAWPTRSNYSFSGYDVGTRQLNVTGSSEMRYITNASTIGYSVRKGSSGLETYYYEAGARTNMVDSNINNVHIQGVYIEAPRVN